MGFEINEKLRRFEPYLPISGDFRARMDANESFIAPDSETIARILAKIGSAALNRYPDPYAEHVCELFANYLGVYAENVVAGNGSDEIISIIVSSFFNKGDRILTFSPEFSMYGFYARISELEHISVHKDEDMLFDIDEARSFINGQNIKGVFLSNPCNPTSVGIPAREILRLAKGTDALIVIDEAYMEFYGDSVIGALKDYDNVIVLKTCSKAFGLAGIRLGFAVAGNKIIDALKAAKSPYNVNLLTQLAAEAALSDFKKIRQNISSIIEARDFLYEGIRGLEGENTLFERVYPTRTNFVFIKSANSSRISEVFRENGVAVRLMGGFLRITAGTREENERAIRILSEIRGE